MLLWSLRARMAFLIDNLQYYVQVQSAVATALPPPSVRSQHTQIGDVGVCVHSGGGS
jgi:hypothetical protein